MISPSISQIDNTPSRGIAELINELYATISHALETRLLNVTDRRVTRSQTLGKPVVAAKVDDGDAFEDDIFREDVSGDIGSSDYEYFSDESYVPPESDDDNSEYDDENSIYEAEDEDEEYEQYQNVIDDLEIISQLNNMTLGN